MIKVSDIMTRGVRTMAPTESLVHAAQAMDELDVGALPVCDGESLVGMVTDRDIVLRGVAQRCAIDDTPLSAVMSRDACWCFEDQSVDEVAQQMRDAQIRRLPVVDRRKHLVGMVSLGDIATKASDVDAGRALNEISEPSSPDRSGQSAASSTAGGGATSMKAPSAVPAAASRQRQRNR
jgi:CBS domain-containing protein